MNSCTLINRDTVNLLLSNPSPAMRAETAAQVARTLSHERLSAVERQLAGEILDILARDLRAIVRQAVADHAKSCGFLPPAVARRLAEDVDPVALPIIRHSKVLSDDDLIAVIKTGNRLKQQAAAARSEVGPRVCEALIAFGTDRIVKSLLANEGARLNEASYHEVITDLGRDREVQQLLIGRILPLSITQRLIGLVAEDLRRDLVERQALPLEIATELARQARDQTLAQVSVAETRPIEVKELAKRLHAKNRLSPGLILRSLCLGDLRFFEVAMALHAGISIASARLILEEGGGPGFVRLFRKTKLAPELVRPLMIGVELVQEVGWTKARTWRTDYSHVMMARMALEIETSLGSDIEAVIASVTLLLSRKSKKDQRA